MSKYADKQKRLKEDETFGYTYDIEEKGMVVEEKSEEDSVFECVRPVRYEEDLRLKRESLAKKRDRIEFIKNEINHLKSVIVAVFKAEDAILDDWSARLKEAPTLGCREKERIADEYVTAIAKELLKNQMRKI